MTNDPIYLEGITKDADMITVDTIADTEYFDTVYFSNKPTVNVLSLHKYIQTNIHTYRHTYIHAYVHNLLQPLSEEVPTSE